VRDRELVAAALATRTRSASLGRERVLAFLDAVLAECRAQAAAERG
jgi:hypothetical protein